MYSTNSKECLWFEISFFDMIQFLFIGLFEFKTDSARVKINIMRHLYIDRKKYDTITTAVVDYFLPGNYFVNCFFLGFFF